MDEAIRYAIGMGEEERRGRMALLREAIERYDVHAWGKHVVNDDFGSRRIAEAQGVTVPPAA